MAHIENIAGTGDLRATLMAMDEPELIAQQIVQQGAVHALETLISHGCTEQAAQDMLASLRSNMLEVEAVAREKGFPQLFAEAELREMREHGNADDATEAAAHLEQVKHKGTSQASKTWLDEAEKFADNYANAMASGGCVEDKRAALLAHLSTAAAPRWPAGLLERVKAAEQRIQDNQAPRRIPADPNGDVDLVLAEVRYLIEGTWPPFWIKHAELQP